MSKCYPGTIREGGILDCVMVYKKVREVRENMHDLEKVRLGEH